MIFELPIAFALTKIPDKRAVRLRTSLFRVSKKFLA